MSYRLNPRKIALILGTIAILLSLQSIYSEYVLSEILGMNSTTAPARILDIFSVNLEESIPTWYSSLNLFLAACLLGWIAMIKRTHKEPFATHWAGLALIFLYLSIDEGAEIHETASGPLQDAFNTTGFLEFGWLILGIPLVILFGLVYVRFWWKLPQPTRTLFAIAGILYVGGAVVIEAISANQYALDNGSSFIYLVIATIEETCEMLGVVTLIYALLRYLWDHDRALIFQTQTTHPDFAPAQFNPMRSKWITGLGFGVVLLLINGGLLIWGIALKDSDPATTAAPYHYYIIVEELAAPDRAITHINGGLSPDNADAMRTITALLDAYDNVQVISLPNRDASVIIAGDTPALTNAEAVELMEWIEETAYIFYDAPVVRAIITGQ